MVTGMEPEDVSMVDCATPLTSPCATTSPLCHDFRPAQILVHQCDQEFLAAVTPDPITRARQQLAHATVRGAKDFIPHRVAVTIVDAFEMIEVHQQHGQWMRTAT